MHYSDGHEAILEILLPLLLLTVALLSLASTAPSTLWSIQRLSGHTWVGAS